MNFDVIVSISALEHWSYCPRQCGLIHLESVWDENVFTIRGTHVHERADIAVTRQEKGVRVERALPIWSDQYGLTGRCDIVEFHELAIVPVEYKSSQSKHNRHAALQLCAQALCLEEMFSMDIPKGFLYFANTKSREEIDFSPTLRSEAISVVESIRSMVVAGNLPPPVNDRRCPQCSLIDACVPGVVQAAARRRPNLFALQMERDLP